MCVFMGNLAARSLSVIFHLWPKISNLLFSRNAPPYDGCQEGVTEAVASFYWGDSDTVFLDFSYDLRPNIIPANFFWVKCVRLHLVMTRISGNVPATFKDFRQLSKDFGTSLKMSPGVPKTFEHSSEVLKRWQLLKCSLVWFH